jgi:hypothetical protein
MNAIMSRVLEEGFQLAELPTGFSITANFFAELLAASDEHPMSYRYNQPCLDTGSGIHKPSDTTTCKAQPLSGDAACSAYGGA